MIERVRVLFYYWAVSYLLGRFVPPPNYRPDLN